MPNFVKIFLRVALLTAVPALFFPGCGGSPVVLPNDAIDATATNLPGDAYARVVTVAPANSTTNLPVNTQFTVIFSLPIDAATLSSGTGISITSSSAGALTYSTNYTISPTTGSTDHVTVTFNSFGGGSPIPYNDTITVTLGAGILDTSAVTIANPQTVSFTVSAAPDTTSPSILAATRSPANGATGVAVASNISINLSETSINPASINPSTFYLVDASLNVIECVRSIAGSTITLNPGANLKNNTVYTAYYTTGITDLSGNALSAGGSWSFTTVTASPTAGSLSFVVGPRLDAVSSTTASVSFDTTNPATSIFNYGLNTLCASAVTDAANYYSTRTINLTGLTAGKQYYYNETVNDLINTLSSSTSIFITPTTEAPVTVRAATDNQILSFSGPRTRGTANSGVFTVWQNNDSGTYSLHSQLYDNSFTALWGTEMPLFTESGITYTYLSHTEDFLGDIIVLAARSGSGIYAKRFKSSDGSVIDWGTSSDAASDTGIVISAGGSQPWAVPVYTATCTNLVLNGIATMGYNPANYLYDSSTNLSAAAVNDIAANISTHTAATVSLTPDFRHILSLSSNLFSSGDSYRIGNASSTTTAVASTHALNGGTTHTSGAQTLYTEHGWTNPGWTGAGDIINNGTTYGYLTAAPSLPAPNMTSIDTTVDSWNGVSPYWINTPTAGIWGSVAVGDLVFGTSATPALVTVWNSSTNIEVDSLIFSSISISSIYHYYCATHPGGGSYSATSVSPYYMMTSDAGFSITNGNTYTLYDLRTSGTAMALPANPLFAESSNFGSVAVNDMVFNWGVAANTTIVSSIINTRILSLGAASMISDGDAFGIIRYPINLFSIAPGLIIAHGTASSGTLTVASAAAGDYVYNATTGRYALVTVGGGALTLSPAITITSGDRYIVFRQRNLLYIWQEGGNIVGRVLSDSGLTASAAPANLRGSLGAPFTIVAGASNPYAFTDERGGSILIYQTAALAYAVLVDGMGNTSGLIQIDTNGAHLSQTIVKAISDGNGGAVVLYKYNATSLAAQHILNTAGVLSRNWTNVALVTAATSQEDFGFFYNTGANSYLVAAWTTANDIYAGGTGGTGFVPWGPVTLCAHTSIQQNPRIFLNGANTLVTWEDYRWSLQAATNMYGIYAQRITAAAGVRAWTANSAGGVDDWNGVPLIMNLLNVSSSLNQRLVPYNNGAAGRLLWTDYRDFTTSGRGADILSLNITAWIY